MGTLKDQYPARLQYYFRIFTNTFFRHYNPDMWTKCKYWLPRLIILGFAVSMVMPAPKFIASMEDAEFVVWLLRLIWVLAFPAGFFVLLGLTDLLRNVK